MNRLLDATRGLSRVLVWIGGTLIVFSALLVTVEVFLRKLFNVSIGGADELSGYAFGVATTLGFAHALFERAHIRVDAAYTLFPRWLKLGASVLGLALLIGFVAIVSFMAWGMVMDTLTHGSRSITPMRTPLAIPQIPWLAGWIFFAFTGALLLATALMRLARGDAEGADRLIGMKSIDEQIEDEKV
ncbi:MAG: TRAP transporter small permease [Pseudomonadota bacterium]